MKKLLILSLALLLALAYGAAYAQEKPPVLDFKASGFYAFEFDWARNYTSGIFSPAARDHSISNSLLRGRLMFTANMGKELSGTVFFEMDANPLGAAPGSADPGTGQRGAVSYWSADRAAVEIKWLYFDVAVPVIPVPISLRIGTQGFMPRPIFFSGDVTGVSGNLDLSPLKVAGYWFKAVEGNVYSGDDTDLYGIKADVKLGTVTVGGYGMYFNCNSYPIWVKRTGTAGSVTTLADYINGTQLADFWYFGAYADGKMGPVNVNFDFIYDTGKTESRYTSELIYPDVKYRGWATWLRIDYPWDIFNFGLGGFYASGDDKTNATKKKGFVSPPLSEGTAPFSEAFIYGGMPAPAMIGYLGAFFAPISYTFANAGYGGSWFVRAQAKAKVTPSYNVTARVYYIGDTTKNGDTWGTAKDDFGNYTDSKSIGWEFDVINSIQIYKNLNLSLGGAVMKLGNAMRYMDGAFTKKPKTPWCITGGLMYSF